MGSVTKEWGYDEGHLANFVLTFDVSSVSQQKWPSSGFSLEEALAGNLRYKSDSFTLVAQELTSCIVSTDAIAFFVEVNSCLGAVHKLRYAFLAIF